MSVSKIFNLDLSERHREGHHFDFVFAFKKNLNKINRWQLTQKRDWSEKPPLSQEEHLPVTPKHTTAPSKYSLLPISLPEVFL